MSFGDRLTQAFARYGRLCVGIDPHAYLLREWGLEDSAAGLREFGLRVVDAASGVAGIVKPQVAFFERHGSAGYAALEDVIAAARAAGLLVIADAKRGDIGTSVEAYGQTWLEPGSPLESDAMTVSAFQGVGSLAKPLDLARSAGKGLFVLAATSNPEAAAIQKATVRVDSTRESTVARAIIDEVTTWNHTEARSAIASVGVVIGATLDLTEFGIDTVSGSTGPAMPVLAPGFGQQGARVTQAQEIYGTLTRAVIVSESRSVLGAGPSGLAEAVERRTQEVREAIG
ncbi:orotidine-5'-phosphate decarboxylase [Compostimonas suwonensis]|nr:orotidine-5'-phosphate decarboxylase [Compostimonas suwonensis]